MKEYVLVGLLILYVGLTVIELVRGYKARRFKYVLKRNFNYLRFMFSPIWIAYFLMGVVLTIPPIKERLETILLLQNDDMGRIIVYAFPFVYILTAYYIVARVFASMYKPIIKYNEQELIWEKESEVKFRASLRKLVFWKHVKET